MPHQFHQDLGENPLGPPLAKRPPQVVSAGKLHHFHGPPLAGRRVDLALDLGTDLDPRRLADFANDLGNASTTGMAALSWGGERRTPAPAACRQEPGKAIGRTQGPGASSRFRFPFSAAASIRSIGRRPVISTTSPADIPSHRNATASPSRKPDHQSPTSNRRYPGAESNPGR